MNFNMNLIIFAIALPLTFTAADHFHRLHRTTRSADLPTARAGNQGMWDNTDWHALADKELEDAIDAQNNIKNFKAKNVIMFLGDGMGISTIAAARLYNAENKNLKGSNMYLSWEKFPHVGLSRTYNADRSTPDSAGTGTAYLCGVKANMETIGVSDKVKFGNCSAVTADTKVRSILKESIVAGKWTGVVSTARITHASPAASYAHVSDRDWEAYMPKSVSGQEQCDDIAKQLIQDSENTQIRVILGGGRRMFLPNVSNADYFNEIGSREDNLDLIKTWQDKHSSGKFVKTKAEFDAIDATNTEYLFGLFNRDHMKYEVDRMVNSTEPSLTEMTEKAIKILQRSDKGYFLFIEGGRIDHSHHDSSAFRALNDTVAMSDAVQKAVDLTNDSDTLIVVTSDHSHVFTFGGYATYSVSVLDVTDSANADDGKPFLQLNYANGPGFHPHRNYSGNGAEVARLDLTNVDTAAHDFLQDAAVPLSSETHGGEDVAIFTRGPMAHLIHGVHEQHYIARVMMYASCVGRDQGSHCNDQINAAYSRHEFGRQLIVCFVAFVTALLALF